MKKSYRNEQAILTKRRIFSLAGLLATAALGVLPVRGATAGVPAGVGDAAEAIRSQTREFVAGYNSGDVDRIMRICGDRFVAINLKNPVQTRGERAAYYRRLVGRRDSEVEITPEEIVVDGDHAVVRGTTLFFLLDAAGKRRKPAELRYMELWERHETVWKSAWVVNAEPDPD